jgi:Ca2+-binding EF-hand superfamily protein
VDRQVLIDRLLESENLTDNLEDDDANTLIKWGIAQINPLVKDIDDEETAGVKINHLMSVMRQINSIAGNLSTVSEEKLQKLLEQYTQTFDKAHHISDEERKQVAEKLSQMQPGEAVKYLLEWMHSQKQQSQD